jgi:MFS family permease
MQSRRNETSRQHLVGVTSGALVLIVFATLWAAFSLQGLSKWSSWTVIVIAGLVTVFLLALCLATLRSARRLPQEKVAPEEQARGKQIYRWFNIIAGVEFTAIAVTSVLLGRFKHPEFIAPVTVLIVGLHFLPLAFLFQVRVYSLLGAFLSLLGGGALLALLLGLTLGASLTWTVIIGLSTAVIFWLTSLYILVRARRVLSLIQQSPEGAAWIEKERHT